MSGPAYLLKAALLYSGRPASEASAAAIV